MIFRIVIQSFVFLFFLALMPAYEERGGRTIDFRADLTEGPKEFCLCIDW